MSSENKDYRIPLTDEQTQETKHYINKIQQIKQALECLFDTVLIDYDTVERRIKLSVRIKDIRSDADLTAEYIDHELTGNKSRLFHSIARILFDNIIATVSTKHLET